MTSLPYFALKGFQSARKNLAARQVQAQREFLETLARCFADAAVELHLPV